MRTRTIALLGVLALVVAACGSGATETAEGSSEGIQVHGEWTIDIYNEDGSLDERVQFHNEFVGAGLLADLLSLTDTMTGWRIAAIPAGGTKICDVTSGACAFDATAQRDPVTDELVVEGSFSSDFDGDVTRVAANIVTTSAGNRNFSNKDLIIDGPGAVTVGAGQVVQVEVRYLFGTLP